MSGNSTNNQLTQDLIDELLAKLRLELETNLLNKVPNNQSLSENSDLQEQQKNTIALAAINFLSYNEITLNPILDSIKIAISIADENGHFVHINQRYSELFGYHKEEIIGKHFGFLLVESEREKIFEKHAAFFKKGFVNQFETIGQKKDGSHIDILISSELFTNFKDNRYRVTTIKDITKEKKLNEALLTKNKIFDYSTELLSIVGFDGYFKLINPSWESKLGWSTEELLSKPFIEFVHPDDVDRTKGATFSIIDGQEVLHFENRYICKDGTYKTLSWNAQPVPNEGIMVSVAKDVTKENELLDALNTKNLIFEYALDMLCIADFDGYYKILNPIWETTLGWTIDELKSKPYIEFVHPDDLEQTKNVKANIVNGSEVYQFENRLLCANGDYKWISWNSHPIPEKGIMVGVARDITTTKRITHKLLESEEKFKHLVEESKAGVFIIKGNKFVYTNQSMCNIFGYTIEEFNDKLVIDIIQPIDQVKIETYTDKLLLNELFDNHISFEGKHKDGKTIYVDIISSITHYEGEKVIIGSLLDVTEQTKHAVNLKKLYTAIEQTHTSVVITNIDGNIEFVNNAFLELTGYTIDEAIGQNPRILKSGLIPEETYVEMWSTLLEKKTWQGVMCNKKKNGKLFWEMATISPVLNEEGNTTNYVAVKEDITQKIGEEEERNLLIEELTRNNKELKQFSYITSHNLRAPLTNLLAIDALIDRSKVTNSETLELVEMMHESIGNLNSTLNDLIKILVIKEQTNIQLQEIPFEEVFTETVHSIQSILNDVEIDADFSGLTNIRFNKTYLESIFLNLLTNSVKYAHPNRKPIIKIVTYALDDKLYLRFSDNGIGFNLDNVKERIFGLYQRFHSNSDGKGIGLYLVHSQVTALGGNIEVYSEENVGTIFTICFNAKARMPIKPTKG